MSWVLHPEHKYRRWQKSRWCNRTDVGLREGATVHLPTRRVPTNRIDEKELAMRLTTKGRFAVTAMIDIGLRQRLGPVNLAAISQRQQISLSYLEQLFGKLRKHNLVVSVRGPGGATISRATAPTSRWPTSLRRWMSEPPLATMRMMQTTWVRKAPRRPHWRAAPRNSGPR